MRLLYSFFIGLYAILIRIASVFNNKAALFVKGRKNIFTYIDKHIYKQSHKIIWIHCASLGEFEQGRPLIEKLKIKHPDHKILLTFFSPSGYEVRKNYDKADWVIYLPMDTNAKAEKFVERINPVMAIFVKYEFWFNYLKVLNDKKIKTYFISVILRKDHYFFKWYGKWALGQLKNIDHFFVQDSSTLKLLNKQQISQATLTGDTRFDRVYEIARQSKPFPVVDTFKGNDLLMVVGSSWQPDEDLIKQFFDIYNSKKLPKLKLLIAPHNLNETNLFRIESTFQHSIRYSNAISVLPKHDVLIIDNVGMLSGLYKYADYTYIGGGFGSAVHNTIEAAVFGMPIFFGPNYHKFKEIHDLIETRSAHCVMNAEDVYKYIDTYINDKELYLRDSKSAADYVKNNIGATDIILNKIKFS